MVGSGATSRLGHNQNWAWAMVGRGLGRVVLGMDARVAGLGCLYADICPSYNSRTPAPARISDCVNDRAAVG